jgi:Uma2 family endonuclease
MSSTIYPEQGQWTEGDYYALDTNRVVELSDGCLVLLPRPTWAHQRILIFLAGVFSSFVRANKLCEILFAPLPIRLWSGKIRMPDVVFLRPGRVLDPRQHLQGADLTVEIVGEGKENRERDLETKRAEYANAGVPEYWIADPQEGRITVLVLDGQVYREHGVFGPGSQATSVLLPGFAVSVDAVLAAGQI